MQHKDELSRKVDEFIANSGLEEIKKAVERSRAARAELWRNMRVDYDSLHQPMTI